MRGQGVAVSGPGTCLFCGSQGGAGLPVLLLAGPGRMGKLGQAGSVGCSGLRHGAPESCPGLWALEQSRVSSPGIAAFPHGVRDERAEEQYRLRCLLCMLYFSFFTSDHWKWDAQNLLWQGFPLIIGCDFGGFIDEIGQR